MLLKKYKINRMFLSYPVCITEITVNKKILLYGICGIDISALALLKSNRQNFFGKCNINIK